MLSLCGSRFQHVACATGVGGLKLTKPVTAVWRRADHGAHARLPTAVFALSDYTLPLAVASALSLLTITVVADEALDTQQQRILDVTNTDANGVRCYVAKPLGISRPSAPVVVLVHQIFGVRMREVELCNDLAAKGYFAVAPDTFNGCCTDYIPRALALGYPAAFKEGATWGVPELHHVMQWLTTQAWAEGRPVVVAGFCYGGGAALRYAATYPSHVAGVVAFYGRPLEKEEDIAKLQAPLLAIYGTADAQFPAAMLTAFEDNLRQHGKQHTIKRYDGLGHAFVKDLAAVEAGGPAGDAWATFLSYLSNLSSASR